MVNTLRVQRALRGKKGVTQFDVAKAAKIEFNRYWRIENGHTRPTDAEIKALARYFRVPASTLFPELDTNPVATGETA